MDSRDEDGPRVLVMDGNERNVNLMRDFLAGEGFYPVAATNVPTGAEIVGNGRDLAFAIVDLDRLGSEVWDQCEQLDDNGVPYLVLSGAESSTIRRKSRSAGAVRFFQKPIPKRLLLNIIDTTISY